MKPLSSLFLFLHLFPISDFQFRFLVPIFGFDFRFRQSYFIRSFNATLQCEYLQTFKKLHKDHLHYFCSAVISLSNEYWICLGKIEIHPSVLISFTEITSCSYTNSFTKMYFRTWSSTSNYYREKNSIGKNLFRIWITYVKETNIIAINR